MNDEQAIEQKVKELEELFERGYNFEFLNRTKTLCEELGDENGDIALTRVAHLLSPAMERLTGNRFQIKHPDYYKEEK
jgi:hypothetical protein